MGDPPSLYYHSHRLSQGSIFIINMFYSPLCFRFTLPLKLRVVLVTPSYYRHALWEEDVCLIKVPKRCTSWVLLASTVGPVWESNRSSPDTTNVLPISWKPYVSRHRNLATMENSIGYPLQNQHAVSLRIRSGDALYRFYSGSRMCLVCRYLQNPVPELTCGIYLAYLWTKEVHPGYLPNLGKGTMEKQWTDIKSGKETLQLPSSTN